jgi:hypothetical protein
MRHTVCSTPATRIVVTKRDAGILVRVLHRQGDYPCTEIASAEWANESNEAVGIASTPAPSHLPSPPVTQQPYTPRPSQAQRALAARGETPQSQTGPSQINRTTANLPHPPPTSTGGGITHSSQFTPDQRKKIMDAIKIGAETTVPLPPSTSLNVQSTESTKESAGKRHPDQTPSKSNDLHSYFSSSQKPLPSIDSTLKNVKATDQSPLKRSRVEAMSEEEFGQSDDTAISNGRPFKVPRVPLASDVTGECAL